MTDPTTPTPECTVCDPAIGSHTHITPLFAGRLRAMLAPGGLTTDAPTDVSARDLIPDVDDLEGFTADHLIRYHAVRAASHHTATHISAHAMVDHMPAADGTATPAFKAAAQQMARNSEAGAAHLNAALLLHLIATRAPELLDVAVESIWDVTPELGALNGEWEDATRLLLDHYKVVTGDTIIAADPTDLTATTTEASA